MAAKKTFTLEIETPLGTVKKVTVPNPTSEITAQDTADFTNVYKQLFQFGSSGKLEASYYMNPTYVDEPLP